MNKTKALFPIWLSKVFSVAGSFSISLILFLSVAELATAAQSENPESAKKYKNNLYIVRMADAPVVAYKGGIAGLKATKPAKGKKIDPTSTEVVQYSAYLDSRHDAAVAAVKGRKVVDYKYTFNGFAAELTPQQADQMKNVAGVISVDKDEIRKLDTSSTPTFLGLTGPTGFYNTTRATGENVVIGIVDSGIWPEHPSFSDQTGVNGNATKDGKLGYQQIPGWHGKCAPGVSFNASNCNQKLIGAQFFNAGFGGNAGILAAFPYEFNSPRDADGHGSHTASTSGGNANVAASGPASVFGNINGIAPRARIAAYKVCWGNGGEGGCATVDSVAAIDQAVADGVDVINFSISGTSTNFRDPVEIAFLFAADAGVFVAASAGNSGPASSTVAHPSPWLTTVAAGTHNRDGQGSVTLGNGVTYSGASVAAALSAKPLIDSTAAGLPGADPVALALCFAAEDNGGVAVLDPAKVAGKVVVCDRGVNARVNKSLAVQQAGGLGMILLNTSANSLNADFHFVPTIHLQNTDRPAVKAYAAADGATAAINAAVLVFNAPAPFTAAFSSRGPLRASNGDLLKPDLIAPGQDILAAVSPVGYGGRLFDLLSGTSMSSPHVAGLAALFKQLHPDWSPMAIKSALMTTGVDVLDGGTPPAAENNPVLIFRQGAGHVQPNQAANPGLVFDAGFTDWLSFICGVQPGGGCAGVTPIDPSNLNVASIAIGDLAGVQTVTRKVTNVGGNPATYTLSYTGMGGITVAHPATLALAAGETKSFAVTFTRTTAALNAYTGGQLRLTDGAHNVRIPMVVRPVALAAPAQVSGSYGVTFGYSGTFTATARGLIPALVTLGTVAQDPDSTFDPASTAGTIAIPVTIAAGTTYARFSLFESDVATGSDMDMYVFNSAGTLVGQSATGTSAEEVNLASPAAGNYTVYVHGWGLPSGSSPFKLHTWLLGTAAAGNMTVSAPASATIGGTGTISLGFSELTAGTKYLGSVVYAGATGMPVPTIVRKDGP
jgi:Subtilase family/Fibronectin type-III domain/Peptidase inhibitor I9/PA domain